MAHGNVCFGRGHITGGVLKFQLQVGLKLVPEFEIDVLAQTQTPRPLVVIIGINGVLPIAGIIEIDSVLTSEIY